MKSHFCPVLRCKSELASLQLRESSRHWDPNTLRASAGVWIWAPISAAGI